MPNPLGTVTMDAAWLTTRLSKEYRADRFGICHCCNRWQGFFEVQLVEGLWRTDLRDHPRRSHPAKGKYVKTVAISYYGPGIKVDHQGS